MKRIKREIALLLSVSSLLLCACGGTSVVEPTPEPVVFSNDPESISAASESVVMLNCYDKNGELSCTGSAFQCFEEGIYVTNYHVVDGIDKIQGCTEKKLYFDIDEIIAADPDRDIAILKTAADPGVAVLPDGDSDAIIKGENVVAIGSPKGFLNTVSKGTYSGVTEFDDGQKLLQFNASISSGSSGGALFNDKGEVIGITSSQYTEGDDLNFAIRMSDVKEVWENKENYINFAVDDTTENTAATYSVKYVLEHAEQLEKSVITITGYISSVHRQSGQRCFFIVDSAEEVTGVDATDVSMKTKTFEKDIDKLSKGEAIQAWIYGTLDIYNSVKDLTSGDMITLTGSLQYDARQQFGNSRTNRNNYFYDGYAIDIFYNY